MIKNKIDKSYSIVLFSLGFSAALAFGSNILLARHLGPNDYGTLSGCLAISVFLGSISVLGIDGFLQNIFGLEKNNGYRWVKSSYSLIFMALLINIILLIFWSFLGPHDVITKQVFLIFTLLIIGHVSQEVVKTIYQISGSFLKLSFIQIYPNIIRFCFLCFIFIFYPKLKLYDIALFYTLVNISMLVLCIKSLYDFKEGNIGIKFVENFKKKLIKYQPSIKELVSKSINYIKSKVYFLFYFYVDIFFIKYLLTDLDLGFYNASYVIIIGSLIFTDAYLKLFAFRYFYYSKHNFLNFKRIFRTGTNLLLSASLLILFVLLLLSEKIIYFIYGYSYSDSSIILIILAFSIPFRFLFTNYVMALRTLNFASHESKNLRNILIIKFPLSFVLIYNYGIIGAGLSTVICEMILFLMCYYYVNKLVFK